MSIRPYEDRDRPWVEAMARETGSWENNWDIVKHPRNVLRRGGLTYCYVWPEYAVLGASQDGDALDAGGLCNRRGLKKFIIMLRLLTRLMKHEGLTLRWRIDDRHRGWQTKLLRKLGFVDSGIDTVTLYSYGSYKGAYDVEVT
jgi:hypothetical protein